MTEKGKAKGRSAMRSGPFSLQEESTLCVLPVAQETPRKRAGAAALIPGLLAVDDDRLVAARMLHAPPFAAREIVHDLADPVGLDAEPLEVVHHHVGREAFAQRAAIAEARRMRR